MCSANFLTILAEVDLGQQEQEVFMRWMSVSLLEVCGGKIKHAPCFVITGAVIHHNKYGNLYFSVQHKHDIFSVSRFKFTQPTAFRRHLNSLFLLHGVQ